jgi:hypothetical protein
MDGVAIVWTRESDKRSSSDSRRFPMHDYIMYVCGWGAEGTTWIQLGGARADGINNRLCFPTYVNVPTLDSLPSVTNSDTRANSGYMPFWIKRSQPSGLTNELQSDHRHSGSVLPRLSRLSFFSWLSGKSPSHLSPCPPQRQPTHEESTNGTSGQIRVPHSAFDRQKGIHVSVILPGAMQAQPVVLDLPITASTDQVLLTTCLTLGETKNLIII